MQLNDIRNDKLDDYSDACDGCYSLQAKLDRLIDYITQLESRIGKLETLIGETDSCVG